MSWLICLVFFTGKGVAEPASPMRTLDPLRSPTPRPLYVGEKEMRRNVGNSNKRLRRHHRIPTGLGSVEPSLMARRLATKPDVRFHHP